MANKPTGDDYRMIAGQTVRLWRLRLADSSPRAGFFHFALLIRYGLFINPIFQNRTDQFRQTPL